MEYNTRKSKLILPEYGRNVQTMVEMARAEENIERRKEMSFAIIGVMGNLNPHLRDIGDFKHKLWDHLAVMSNFTLSEFSPYDAPVPEEIFSKPERLPYSNKRIEYRHYGRTTERLLKHALTIEKGAMRDEYVRMIANHMKNAYYTWNKESVNDQIIKEAVRDVSNGDVSLPDDMRLADVREHTPRLKVSQNPKRKPPRSPRQR